MQKIQYHGREKDQGRGEVNGKLEGAQRHRFDMVFHTPFNSLQDLTDSDVIAEFRKQIEGKQARLSPMVSPANAANEAGMTGIQGIKSPSETTLAIFAAPDQISIRFDSIKHHRGSRANRDFVTDLELLKFR